VQRCRWTSDLTRGTVFLTDLLVPPLCMMRGGNFFMPSRTWRAEILSKFPPPQLVYMRSAVLQYKRRENTGRETPKPYRL